MKLSFFSATIIQLLLLSTKSKVVYGRLGNNGVDDDQANNNRNDVVLDGHGRRRLDIDNCSAHGNGNSVVDENVPYALIHIPTGKYAKITGATQSAEVQLHTNAVASNGDYNVYDYPDEYIWKISNRQDTSNEIHIISKLQLHETDGSYSDLKFRADATYLSEGTKVIVNTSGRNVSLKTKSNCNQYKILTKYFTSNKDTFKVFVSH